MPWGGTVHPWSDVLNFLLFVGAISIRLGIHSNYTSSRFVLRFVSLERFLHAVGRDHGQQSSSFLARAELNVRMNK